MKKVFFICAAAMLVSLFIYAFYRTDRTVVNVVLTFLFGPDGWYALKSAVAGRLPMPSFIVYSLPEGLWVLCITLLSKPYFLRLGKKEVPADYFPLLFAIGFELVQLLHLSNGRFDVLDLAAAMGCWLLGKAMLRRTAPRTNLLRPIGPANACCLAGYAVVYLAHVFG